MFRFAVLTCATMLSAVNGGLLQPGLFVFSVSPFSGLSSPEPDVLNVWRGLL